MGFGPGFAQAPTGDDPRTPCGPLSETLWSTAADELQPLLNATHALSGESFEPGSVLGGVDCTHLDEADFAAMAQIATLLPVPTDPGFIQCAIERESSFESFPLWALLDAAATAHLTLAGLDDTKFSDPRTLRRLEALREGTSRR